MLLTATTPGSRSIEAEWVKYIAESIISIAEPFISVCENGHHTDSHAFFVIDDGVKTDQNASRLTQHGQTVSPIDSTNLNIHHHGGTAAIRGST